MSRSDEAAWGERNAVTGYYPQYRLSAALVIRALREGTLRWIGVADPKAGRVDDFQIATEHRVDAFQFKWSRFGGAITLNDLLRRSDGNPCLIAQLADGWKRLQATHPALRVVVHLVTNQHPSTSDHQLPAGDPPPTPRHFAAFLEQVWKPVADELLPHESIPREWHTTWRVLSSASGLSDEEFRSFVTDCKLEFGKSLPSAAGLSVREAEAYERDLSQVAQSLFATVFDPRTLIHLDANSLLARLGWSARLEYRNAHRFPVNDALYQPIEDSREALEKAVSELSGGYVAVLGSPGSGKSTFLTQTLRYTPYRVVRYYAFVPESQSGPVRGEASNFLHDVVRALEDAGFRSGAGVASADDLQLRERFHEQIRLLHEEWLSSGRKTIILVDGLDHISREQRPIRSLLRELPPPDNVPDGVFIVLGSQTDQLDDIPTSVQFSIQSHERRIEMGRLSRDSIRRVIDKAGLAQRLSEEQREEVCQLSSGHPLALVYLLRRLDEARADEEVQLALNESAPYTGSIEELYYSYWRQIDEDDEVAVLLGLVARIRGAVRLDWVETWVSEPVLRRFTRRFRHLFRTEDQRWFFFHNSFRLFVAERTARSTTGEFDPTKDRRLHYELALRCHQSQMKSVRWEKLFYLSRAGADSEIIQEASIAFFRQQLFEYRSAEAIRADVALAIRAAARTDDLAAVVRMLFADAEFAQRESRLEELPIARRLIALGQLESALEYLRHGERLRAKPAEALRCARELLRAGADRDARHVFDLAEPVDLLSGSKEMPRYGAGDEHDQVRAWADVACFFRPTGSVIASIKRLHTEPERSGQWAEGEMTGIQASLSDRGNSDSVEMQCELIYRVASSLLNEQRGDDLDEIGEELRGLGQEGAGWWLALKIRCWRALNAQGDRASARNTFHETLDELRDAPLTHDDMLVLAEAALRLDSNEAWAHTLFAKVTPPEVLSAARPEITSHTLDNLLRYARLLYSLGETRTPVELIPLPEDVGRYGLVYFQRAVFEVAAIWAGAWRRETIDSGTVRQKAFALIRFFYLSNRDRTWDNWYSLTSLRTDLHSMLIQAVAAHGDDALTAVAETFFSEWETKPTAWSAESIRRLSLDLHTAGISREHILQALARADTVADGEELLIRIDESVKQAAAWLAIGRDEEARTALSKAIEESSFVGPKDYQLLEWAQWLQRANELMPEAAAQRVAWFALALVELERNGGPERETAVELLIAAFPWSPRRAVKLSSWLLSEGLVSFEDAVRSILRSALTAGGESVDFVTAVLRDLLLPICDVDAELMSLIATRTCEQHSTDRTREVLREFADAIVIFAPPLTRAGWRRAIGRAAIAWSISLDGLGLTESDLQQEREDSTDSELRLNDGTKLARREIAQIASSVGALRKLLERVEHDYFNWDPIVLDLASTLESGNDVAELASLFANRGDESLLLARLAERIVALRDADNARAVAKMAISMSSPSGWAYQLSGAPLVHAYRALVACEGDVGRRQAFGRFVDDLTHDHRYPAYTARNLRKILPLLTDDVPEDDIWIEIESYLQGIFPELEASPMWSDLMRLFGDSPDEDVPVRAIADLLAPLVVHPTGVIAHGAQKALLGLLLKGERTAYDAVRRLLQGSENEQESVLALLDAVSTSDAAPLDSLRTEIQALAVAPSFAIRRIVHRLAGRLGLRLPIARESGRASVLLDLHLPPGLSADEAWREANRGDAEFVLPVGDPYERLMIVLHELEALASLSGVSKENLIFRTARLSQELARDDQWAVLGVSEMLGKFRRIGLEYSYRKPKANLARRAFFHLASELLDSGRIDLRRLRQLDIAFQYYDPDIYFLNPVPRPAFAAPHRFVVENEVVDAVTRADAERYSTPQHVLPDGTALLAEFSKFKRLEWATPKVKRKMQLAMLPPDKSQGAYSFFAGEVGCLVRDYPRLTLESAASTVFWHSSMMSDSPGPGWLAFHPDLARSFCWRPNPNRLFGWSDSHGNPMVWSIYWLDGLYEQQPPRIDEVVGWGWAVLGAPQVVDILKERFGPFLSQYTQINRSWREDGAPQSVMGEWVYHLIA